MSYVLCYFNGYKIKMKRYFIVQTGSDVEFLYIGFI